MAGLGRSEVEITVDTGEEVPVVRIVGELDLTNADELDRAVAALAGSPPPAVVFDLERLAFMDSSALTVFVRLAATGTDVSLRRPSPVVTEVVEATGLGAVLRLETG